MRGTNIILLALVAAVLFSGRTTMAKQAVSEIRGARGKVVVVRDAPHVFYAGLSGVTVGQVADVLVVVSGRAIRTKAREVAETFAKLLLEHLTENENQRSADRELRSA